MTITHTFETETEDKKTKFPKLTLVFIGALLVLGVLEIWVSHTLSAYGERFESIEKMKMALSLENQILENQISRLSTLSEIATKSGELGLKKSTDVKYIQ